MYDEVQYREARRRAIRRLIKNVLFYADLAFTLIVLWVLFTPHTVPDQAYTWWLSVFLIHAFYYFRVHRLWSRLIDHLTQQELKREAEDEKPKRDARARLVDDGELLYEDQLIDEAQFSKSKNTV